MQIRRHSEQHRAATFCGAFWAECADDYVTSRVDSVACGEKMKHRAVVPHLVSSRLKLYFCNIGGEGRFNLNDRQVLRRHRRNRFATRLRDRGFASSPLVPCRRT
jgi:hypothetical protein